MPKSSRRYKPLHQSNGGGFIPGCDRVRMPRARALLLCLLAVLVLAVVLGVYLSNDTSGEHVNRMPAADLTKDRVRVVWDKQTQETVTYIVHYFLSFYDFMMKNQQIKRQKSNNLCSM